MTDIHLYIGVMMEGKIREGPNNGSQVAHLGPRSASRIGQ